MADVRYLATAVDPSVPDVVKLVYGNTELLSVSATDMRADEFRFLNDPDTGIRSNDFDTLQIVVGGSQVGSFNGSFFTAPDNWVFKDDLNTGFVRVGADDFEARVGGSAVARFLSGALRVPDTIRFLDDTDCGLTRVGSDSIALTVGGTNVLNAPSTGIIGVSDILRFRQDTDCQINRPGSDQMDIEVGGVEMIKLIESTADEVKFPLGSGNEGAFQLHDVATKYRKRTTIAHHFTTTGTGNNDKDLLDLAKGTCVQVVVEVCGWNETSDLGYAGQIRGTFKSNSSGTSSQVGSDQVDYSETTDMSPTVQFVLSGDTVRCRVAAPSSESTDWVITGFFVVAS